MAQSLHRPDDVYTSAVDEEIIRELPTYPYAYYYEHENGPASTPAPARAWTNTAARNWDHDRNRNRNDNNSDSVMTERTRTGIRTTSNASPISTVNHTPATRNANFNRDLSNADAGAEPQAMQTYSRHQVSTTMNGAGEIQSQQEVSTQRFGQDQLHASNSGLKLKLDLNLDVEVELKAKIHGDLTLALLRFLVRAMIVPHPVSPADEHHLSQPSASPEPSASGAWARRRRPPKLRRRQAQDSGEPPLPPDTAMPLAQPARNNLSKQSPEWRDSHAHVNGAWPDNEHELELERGSNSHSTAPSSEPAPFSKAEDTSSLGAGPTPAHPHARNMQQQIVLDRTQDGVGRDSQRLMQINNVENPSGEIVRDTQTKTVKTVNGVKDGVIGSITRHEQERGLQERAGKTNNNEQLRLRLDLNLDLEVQLKAKVRGDLTLQLMALGQWPILWAGWE
ncbi:hypothetical protein BDW72DRAFT_210308 [Aspergillus terricola var. indicus]